MKITIENKMRKTYVTPVIEIIKLDNEISLVLATNPDEEPIGSAKTPEYFNNDPFKTDLA